MNGTKPPKNRGGNRLYQNWSRNPFRKKAI